MAIRGDTAVAKDEANREMIKRAKPAAVLHLRASGQYRMAAKDKGLPRYIIPLDIIVSTGYFLLNLGLSCPVLTNADVPMADIPDGSDLNGSCLL